jgi:RNA-binding protein
MRSGRQGGRAERSTRLPADEAPRPPKKKKKRSPGPKGRIAKRTGDIASKPDKGRERSAGPTTLTGKATRYLRGLGHHLDPIVQIGKEGITDGVVEATRAALLAHELVKIKVSPDAPVDRKDAGTELAGKVGALLAQTLGRTLLLYKRHPHEPRIVLPR